MIDKETLILAAKAIGIEFYKEDECGLWHTPEPQYTRGFRIENAIVWNSFNHNSDCFCLETALGMSPIWYDDRVAYQNHGVWVSEAFADHNGDKDKARRYASTKAAALIKG